MWDVAFLRFRVRKKTQSRSHTLLVSHTFFSPLVSLLLFSFRAGQKNSWLSDIRDLPGKRVSTRDWWSTLGHPWNLSVGIFLIDMEKPRRPWVTPFPRQGGWKNRAKGKQASKQACIHFSLVLKVDVMWLFLSSSCHGDFSWIMDHNLELSAYNKRLPPPVSFLSEYFIRAVEMKLDCEATRARRPWWAPAPWKLTEGEWINASLGFTERLYATERTNFTLNRLWNCFLSPDF